MNTIIKLLILPAALFTLTACGYVSDSMAESGNDNASEAGEAKVDWLTDYEKAVEKSREEGRPILMNFTGSDWCPPCIQMKNDVLTKDEFLEYAEENLVLLELDFPRQTPQDPEIERQNQQLAQKFEIGGFPTFVVVDDEGEELRRTVGYMRGGPGQFVSWIDG